MYSSNSEGKIKRSGKVCVQGRKISNMILGFWIYMISSRDFQTFWSHGNNKKKKETGWGEILMIYRGKIEITFKHIEERDMK